MKTIEIPIPEGKKAEWVNDVLTLVDEKPIEYKFNIGDMVKTLNNSALTYAITGQFAENGEPMYKLSDGFGETSCAEKWLTLIPQDITDRIKTLEDACNELGDDHHFVIHYKEYYHYVNNKYLHDAANDDILAYLKLRIITCALNEGWKPSKEERYYAALCADGSADCGYVSPDDPYCMPDAVCFKSTALAIYAATQFRDIYADFCGCKKGGEK